MRLLFSISIFILTFLSVPVFAQKGEATLTGQVKDENGKPIDLVSVVIQGSAVSTLTSTTGQYKLQIPAGRQLYIVFALTSGNNKIIAVSVKEGETRRLDVVLKDVALQEAVIVNDNRRREPGSVILDPKQIETMATPVSGFEAMIKQLVGSNNELTSQYSVRGGNYDENLVYVNDFEIYRPYLTRSGQQEGLSFVNPDLAAGASFSLGGFQAKYGDKMSSVLDVDYKKPKSFAGSVTLSLLGAGMHFEGTSKNKKLSYLVGLRQKSNQYILQSQPTKGNYYPSFTDAQALINYRFNDKWEMEVIANYARNRFTFEPESSTSSFGLINQAYQLQVFYNGNELDQFDSRFGGISTTYKPNSKLKLKLLASGFQTNEKETYDIQGEYLLGELETDLSKSNFGQVKTALGTGIIQSYARNYLDINVGTIAHRGSYSANKHFFQWGADATFTGISDKLHEWERRDSAGYNQPNNPTELKMNTFLASQADFNYMRATAFLQDNFRFNDSLDLLISAGVRFNYSSLNGETIVSPRVQISYKPKWKSDIVFKVAGGLYAQPPFYREMRDLQGNVNMSLQAQRSVHYVIGSDYNFIMGDRPVKLTSEVYYKQLTNLVPYEYDNVRIRYFGKNDANGYAYGGELRLYGDLVKDASSWVSVGLMKTMENLTDDSYIVKNQAGADSLLVNPGYIPRPNDQRVVFSMFFQDYLPSNKNFRVHLNLMYATGLPFGQPNGERYADTLRLPDYRRVDVGFSALLLDGDKKERRSHSLFRSMNSIWASLEVFNLLAIRNTISYTWIQDQSSGKTFAVPNRLTSRLVNVKLVFKF